MLTQNATKKGKSAEYRIIAELLKYNFDVYVPVVDVDGIDLIAKNKNAFIEVQVKSRYIKQEKEHFAVKEFIPRGNFFIVCHNLTTDDFYVMPSINFHNRAMDKQDKRGKKKVMTFAQVKKYEAYKNMKGIELLERALRNPKNRINQFLIDASSA